MFDGALGTAASDLAQDTTEYAKMVPLEAPEGTDGSEEDISFAEALRVAGSNEDSGKQEVVFIDFRVANVQQYVHGLPGNVEFILIDQESDGVAQIAAALDGREGIDAIHILSHGHEGKLALGNGNLTLSSMGAGHADALAEIGASLADQADILVYGCNFTGGAEGLAAAAMLAELTGADVAASIDDTGHADLGGDWDLETEVGTVSTASISAEAWEGILAPFTISVSGAPTVTGGTGVGAVALWENAGTFGSDNIDLRATVLEATPGAVVNFATSGDDAQIQLNSVGEVRVVWEIFENGTSQTVRFQGDLSFTVQDLDGDGTGPETNETIAADFDGLTSYTVDDATSLVISTVDGTLRASGTANVTAADQDAWITYNWTGVSRVEAVYVAYNNAGRFFDHDGDNDLVFSNPVTTSSPEQPVLDLDTTESVQDFSTVYASGAAAIALSDSGIDITDSDSTQMSSAVISLTNAVAGDALTINGTAVTASATGTISGTSITYTVSGDANTITLSGADSVVNYEAALDQIGFSSTSTNYGGRVIEIQVVDDTTFASETQTTIIQVAKDTDGDGVADIVDIDDDNDGILDSAEVGVSAGITGSWTDAGGGVYTSSYNGTPISVTFGTPSPTEVRSFSTGTMTSDNPSWFYESGLIPGADDLQISLVWDNDPEIVESPDIDLPGDDKGTGTMTIDFGQVVVNPILNIERLGGGALIGNIYTRNGVEFTVTTPGVALQRLAGTDHFVVEPTKFYAPEVDVEASGSLPTTTAQTAPLGTAGGSVQLLGTFQTLSFSWTGIGVEGNGADGVEMVFSSIVPKVDSDGDSIADSQDLDSDNDGIADLRESGTSSANIAADTNNDGTISIAEAEAILGVGNADADGDGLLDIFDADTGDISDAASQGTTPVDSDTDGVDDVLDLDSDGDGIPDTVEARPTAGYTANDGDVSDDDADGDGVIAAFDSNDGTTADFGGSFTAPENTDGDATPDYLDVDSDNDPYLDSLESGLTLSGTIGAGGIDTGVNASYADPDGDINDPSATLANQTGDTAEVGYRESTDTDGDGVGDAADIDDDNDGILDSIEHRTTTGYAGWTEAELDGAASGTGAGATLSSLNTTIAGKTVAVSGQITSGTGSSFRGDSYNYAGSVNADAGSSIVTDPIPVLSVRTISDIAGDTGGLDAGFVEIALTPGELDEFNLFVSDAEWAQFVISASSGGTALSTSNWTVKSYEQDGTSPADAPNAATVNATDITFAQAASQNDDAMRIAFDQGTLALADTIRIDFERTEPNNGLDDNFEIYFTGGVYADTDGDGAIDAKDLDSDNDGIADLRESGTSTANIAADTNNDGTISLSEAEAVLGVGNADADDDGLFDVFDADTADSSEGASQGTTPADRDADGVEDYLDLDSDGDGIPDTVEARPTASYTANDGDVSNDDADGDGVIALFDSNDGTTADFGGSFTAPENTNGGGYADYLDADSDSDKIWDKDESGLTLSGTIGADGIDTGVNATYADPDGDVNSPSADLANQTGDTTEVAYREEQDTDGDGIVDSIDIDDDNDGILDVNEYGTQNDPAATGSPSVLIYHPEVGELANIVTPTSVTVNDNTDVGANAIYHNALEFKGVLYDVKFSVVGQPVVSQQYDFNTTNKIALNMPDFPGVGELFDFQVDIFEAGTTTPAAVNFGFTIGDIDNGRAVVRAADIVDYHFADPTDVTATVSGDDIIFSTATSGAGTPNIAVSIITQPGISRFNYSFEKEFGNSGTSVGSLFAEAVDVPNVIDTDGDGVSDDVDLDSDNDGISDLRESGASTANIAADTNNDGTISISEAEAVLGVGNADADGDGLLDIFDVDTGDTTEAASQGTTLVDSDTDGVDDVLDLDSDGDGIPDTVEARPTAGYTANDGDVSNDDADGDGVIALFDSNDGTTADFGGSFTAPEDTDGDTTPDYLDTDSDDDTLLDAAESGLTLSGTVGADGIDTGGNASYTDPDGDVNAPTTDLANETGDTAEVGYREISDKDGDGVADIVDIDDDNDGIVDGNEDTIAEVVSMGSNLSGTTASGVVVTTTFFEGEDTYSGAFNDDPPERIDNPDFTFMTPGVSAVEGTNLNFSDTELTGLNETMTFDFSGKEVTEVYFHFNSLDQIELHFLAAQNPGLSYEILSGENVVDGGVGGDMRIYLLDPLSGDATFDDEKNDDGLSADFTVRFFKSDLSSFTQLNLDFVENPARKFGGQDGFQIAMEVRSQIDTDGDSVINSADLDSDNDGISDLRESGASAAIIAADTNNDGTISISEAEAVLGVGNADADGDGLLDIFDVDTGDTTEAASLGTDPVDSDTDGVDDFLDLDSDGDGIPDTVEARPTAGYTANDGNVSNDDADGDGVIALFDSNDGTTADFGGSFTAPEDTDGDTTPDYLDTDSDDDTLLDSAESGLTLSGTVGADGIDTGVNASYTDPDGDVNAPTTDLANETGGTAEVGYREEPLPPIATDNSYTRTEDDAAAVIGNVITDDTGAGSDSDPNAGTTLTTVAQTDTAGTTGGLFSLDTAGNVTFDPNAAFDDLAVGESRDTSFTYTLTDSEGGTDTATVTVTITGVNDAPVVVGGSEIADASGNDGETIAGIDVTTAFSDPDTSDTLTYTATGLPAGLTLNPTTGLISGTIDPSASQGGPLSDGVYTVEVTADDGNGGTISDTFVYTVSNTAPNATANTYSVNEDAASAVIGNVITDDTGAGVDSDTDGDTLTTIAQTDTAGSAGGLFSLDTSGNVTFDPNGAFEDLALGETRDTSFTYTLTDSEGGTDTATVTVTVTGVNDAPIVVGGSEIADASGNDGETIAGIDVTSAFSDPDTSDTLTYTATGLPAGLTLNPTTGLISGTIDPSASQGGPLSDGVYTVEVTADDGNGGTVTDTFTYTVANTAPNATANTYSVNEDAASAVIGNVITDDTGAGVDSDLDGDTLSTIAQTDTAGTTGGLFSLDTSGNVTFDPNGAFEDLALGESRDTSFTYTLTDSEGGTDTATVTVTVTGVNDAPIVVGGSEIADTSGNDGETITAIDVTSAFSDPDTSDTLTYTATGLPAGLTLNPTTGLISGTIDPSASQGGPLSDGVYTVEVTADDGNGGTVTDTFTYTVANTAPNATANTYSVNEDAASAVIGNVITDDTGAGIDSDADGDTLTTIAQTDTAGSAGGLFSLDTSGNVTFDPNAAFDDLAVGESRDTSFTYTLTDSEGGTDTATVTVTVTGVNDAPVVVGGSEIADASGNDGETITAIDVTSAFSDPDTSDTLTYTATGLPAGLTLNPTTGLISGTIDPSASQGGPLSDGVYTVEVTADDGNGGTISDTFVYTVSNTAPNATANTYSVNEDAASAVIGNVITDDTGAGVDSDLDGDTLTTIAQTDTAGSAGGLFSLDTSGNVTFDPNAAFDDLAVGESRDTSFTYTLTDSEGGTDTATVTVTVTGVNDAPVVVGGSEIADASGNDGETIAGIDVTSAFSDPDTTDTLTYTATGLPAGLTLNPTTGLISGTIDPSASQGGPLSDGVYTVEVTADDGNGGTVTDTFIYTVSNTTPNATANSYTVNEDAASAVIGNVITDDTGAGIDSDLDGDTLTTIAQTDTAGTTGGLFSLDTSGNVTFDPNAAFDDLAVGESRDTSFTYTLTDSEGGTDTATVTVTVTGVNDAPVVVGGSEIADASGNDGETITAIDVTTAFSDPDTSDTLTYTATGLPAGLTLNPTTGLISGTIDPSASQGGPLSDGVYTVEVTADDGNGGTVTDTFTYTVSNTAPNATANSYTTNEDAASAVIGNVITDDTGAGVDSDLDGDTLTTIAQTDTAGTTGGLFSLDTSGNVTFDPNGAFDDLAVGESRDTSFTYTLTDSEGGTDTATVTVTVTGVNDAPVVVGGSEIADASGNDGETITAIDVTTAFSDPDTTDTLTYTATGLPAGLTLNPTTGLISGTIDPSASQGGPLSDGVYTVEVTADDGNGGTVTDTFIYTVSNTTPNATANSYTVNEDAASAVIGNVITDDTGAGIDSDLDGDTLTTIAQTDTAGSAGGLFSLDTSGNVTFDPNGAFDDLAVGESRDTSFTYTLTDSEGGTDTATVTVTVTGVNDAPVVVGGSEIADTSGNDGETITAIDVTSAFSDPDSSDVLTYTATGLPAGLTLNPTTGLITGTIDPSASQGGPLSDGVYTVEVTADDGNGGTVTDTFIYTVGNTAPNATANSYTVNEDAASAVIGNVITDDTGAGIDSDADGDTLSTIAQTDTAGSAGGLFSLDTSGNVTFDPNGAFDDLAVGESRDTSFTYTLTDSEGGTDTATVTVTVTGVNDAPVVVGGSEIADTSGNDGETITAIDVTSAFSDPDTSDTLTYTATGLPAGLTLNATTGLISGTIDPSASTGGPLSDGVYTVEVTAADGNGGTVTDTFTYTVSNTAPNATANTYSVNEDAASAVIGNVITDDTGAGVDSDADGDTLSTVAQTDTAGTTGGLFSLDTAGNVTFDPNAAFDDLAVGESRDTSFTYTLSDGEGGTDTATVTVTVTGVNDAPVVVGGSEIADASGNDGETIAGIDVTTAFDDPDTSDTLTYTATGLPTGLTLNPTTGLISGTIDPSASTGGPLSDGVYTVEVTAADGNGGTVTDTFTYTVSNTAPNATANTYSVNEDAASAVIGNVITDDTGAGVDSDADGDTLSTVAQTDTAGSAGGLFSLDTSGNVTFDPNAAFDDLAVGETRDTSFTYTLTDSEGGTDTATVTVTVTGVNDAPIVVGGSEIADASGNDGETITAIDVTSAFSDPDTTDTLTYTATGLPAGLTLNPTTGLISGTIDPSASQGGPLSDGVYTVEVTADDGNGGTISDTFVYTVSNTTPNATANSYTVNEDAASAVIGNVITDDTGAGVDSDADGDTLTTIAQTDTAGSAGGLFSLDTAGNVTFDPNAAFDDLAVGESRDTSFTYTLSDGEGGTDTATVTVTVTGVNDAPVVVGGSEIADTSGNDGETIAGIDVTTAFSDPDTSDTLTYTATGLPAGLTLNPTTGLISGTIDPSASQGGPLSDGVYTVEVTADDGNGGTVTDTFIYTVSNTAPNATANVYTVNEDAAAAVIGNVITDDTGAGVDSDADGDTLSTIAQTDTAGSAGGLFSLDTSGNVTFDPNGAFEDLAVGESRDTSFTYTLTDSEGGTDTATVTVTVTGVNDAPVVVGGSEIADTSGNDGETIAGIDVTSAFSDPDTSDTLTYTATGLPAGLTLNATTGLISGTIDPSASQGGPLSDGVYTVEVTADDGNGGTVTDTFIYTVSNTAPNATANTYSVNEDAASAVIGNVITDDTGAGVDSDADGDTLTTIAQTDTAGSAGGLFSLDTSGNVTFDPNGAFEDLAVGESRDTSFTYTLTDSEGGTDTATVTVTVTGVNDAPVVVGGSEIADASGNDGETITAIDVTTAFSDPDSSDVLTYTATGLPAGLTLNPTTGLISGTIDPSASQGGPLSDGVYTVEVTADDGNGGTVTDTFIYTVGNTAPNATANTYSVNEDAASAVIGNVITDDTGAGVDSDADGDTLSTIAQTDTAGSAGGLFSLDTAGNVTFDPNAAFDDLAVGESRDTSFTYTLTDSEGGTDTATVTVTVTGVNDAPIVVGGSEIADASGNDGETITAIDVTTAFSDPDTSDTLTYTATGLPAGLTLNPTTGLISGTIDPSASQGGPLSDGVYSVEVTADDGNGGTVTDTFIYTVSNTTPNATANSYTVNEDAASAVIGNVITDDTGAGVDSDLDGDTLSTIAQTDTAGTTGGLFSLDTAGNVTFDPNAAFDDLAVGESRDTSFTYTLTDSEGGTDTATVTVTVTGVNDAPVVVGGSEIADTSGNDGETITAIDVTSAFSDPDTTDTLTYTATGLPAGLTLNPTTGLISGTIDPSASQGGPLSDGVYTVEVTADDGNGGTVTDTFIYTVSNTAPNATANTYSVNEDAASAVIGNVITDDTGAGVDSDADGDTLTTIAQTDTAGSAGGLFSLDTAGNVTFDPNGAFDDLAVGETRDTSFTYTLTDSEGGTDTATVTVTVTGVNDAPIVVGGSEIADTSGNDGETITAIDVTTAFDDPDTTDTLTYTATGLPAGLTLNPTTGLISGTIDPSASQGGPLSDGVYTVEVTADDGNGGTVTDTFTYTVSNTTPNATANSYTVNEDAASAVIGNVITDDTGAGVDSDADGDTLTTIAQTDTAGTTGGLFSLDTAGNVTFDPNAAFEDLAVGESRDTSFTYTLTDSEGGTDTATVTVTVTGVNDAPVVVGGSEIADTSGNDGETIAGIDVTTAFSDPDTSDTLTYTATGLPAGLTLNPTTGLISGTIDPSASQGGPLSDGVYTVEVTADDGNGGTVTDTFIYTVSNTAPNATANVYTVNEDAAAAVIGNVITDDTGAGVDSDADGDTLSTIAQTDTAGSAGGLFSLDTAGNVTFDPNAAFDDLAVGESRDTSFTYTLSDSEGGTDTATVTVTVTGVNDAPIVVGGSEIADASGNDGETITAIDVTSAFSDPDTSDTLTYTATGLPAGLTLNPTTGLISGTIDPSASQGGPLSDGVYTVEVTADDGNGGTVTDTFVYTVGNTAPNATANSYTVNEDAASAVIGNVITDDTGAGIDSDADGDTLTTIAQTDTAGTTGGLFSLDTSGNVTFDPNGAFEDLAVGESRDTSFTYTLTDSEGGTDTATVTVTVTGVNDAPVVVGGSEIADASGNDGETITAIDVTTAFDDPDTTDTLTYTATGLPAGLTLNPTTGLISGTIDPSASTGGPLSDGVYTVEVTADDGNGGTVTDTFTYTVSNTAPNATANSYTTNEDAASAVIGNVITDDTGAGVDSDLDGDTLTTIAQTDTAGSAGGLFSLDTAGNVTFDPNGAFDDLAVGESRDTSFTYTLTDSEGGTDTATVTVTVTGVNDAPVVVGGSEIADTSGNDGETITAIDVTTAFSDPDTSDTLTYTATGLPAGLTLNPTTGLISGTIDPSASQGGPLSDGVYTVEVTADDGNGGTVTDTFTYTVANTAPNATANTYSVNEDAASAVIGNVITDDTGAGIDSDADGDTLTTVAQTDTAGSAGGLFSLDTSGNVTFDPNGAFDDLAVGESRDTSFTYTLTDSEGGTDTATVTVTVTGVNDAPVVVGGSEIADTSGNDGETITAIDVTTAFSDPDTSDTLTYSATGLPAGLTLNPTTGLISGTIDPSASQGGPLSDGVYTVEVTADDGNGGTVTDTFIYTVGNPAPTAIDDSATTDQDSVVSSDVSPGILGQDNDADGDPLTVVQIDGAAFTPGNAVTLPSGALVTMQPDGSFDYDPNGVFDSLGSGESTTDSFTYQISDGEGGTDTATVTLTINGLDDALGITGLTDGAIGGTDGTVLESDLATGSNPAGTGETISGSFTIEAIDGIASLDVGGTNIALASLNASGTTPIAIATDNGTVTINGFNSATGEVSYEFELTNSTDHAGGTISESIALQLNDADGDSSPATLLIAITDDAPEPVGDTDDITEDSEFPTTGNVLLNDDLGADPNVAQVTGVIPGLGSPAGSSANVGSSIPGLFGSLIVDANGDYSYALDNELEIIQQLTQGETVTDSFTYEVTDSDGSTGTAVLDIIVNGVNDPPQLISDHVSSGESIDVDFPPIEAPFGAAIGPIDVGQYFADIDENSGLTYQAEGLPPGITIDPDTGIIAGIPETSLPIGAEIQFTVTATDSFGETASGTSYLTATSLPSSVNETQSGANFSSISEDVPVRDEKFIDADGIVLDVVESVGDNQVSEILLNDGRYIGEAAKSPDDTEIFARDDGMSKTSNDLRLVPRPYQGASLRFDPDDPQIQRGEGVSEILIDSISYENELNIELTFSAAGRANLVATEYQVKMFDGSPAPKWISVDPNGYVLIEKQIGLEDIKLKVSAILSDGSVINRYIEISVPTGAIVEISQEEELSQMFSDQLNLAAHTLGHVQHSSSNI